MSIVERVFDAAKNTNPLPPAALVSSCRGGKSDKYERLIRNVILITTRSNFVDGIAVEDHTETRATVGYHIRISFE